jgi:hypothetical protein
LGAFTKYSIRRNPEARGDSNIDARRSGNRSAPTVPILSLAQHDRTGSAVLFPLFLYAWIANRTEFFFILLSLRE